MNILIISFSLGNAMGDCFRAVTRNLSQRNHVYVLTNAGERQEILGTKDVCCINFSKKRVFDFINPRSYYRIWKYVKNIKFDIVFIFSPHPVNIFIYGILRNRMIIPFVHDHVLHEGVPVLDAMLLRSVLWFNYKMSRKIIVSCHFIKNNILDKRLMTDGEKIEVNYLGMLPNLVFPELKSEEDIDVLFFGRIEKYKGLDVLVEVANSLPDTGFYVIGRGDFSKVSGCYNLPSNMVRIDNYVEDKKLAEYIQKSKVVILPYHDATGTQTVQAAFYYGKPVIATRVGCFPEYVADGVDGILCQPRDAVEIKKAIVCLLENPSLRHQMGENGKKKLSTLFSEETITCNYERIFHSVCQ